MHSAVSLVLRARLNSSRPSQQFALRSVLDLHTIQRKSRSKSKSINLHVHNWNEKKKKRKREKICGVPLINRVFFPVTERTFGHQQVDDKHRRQTDTEQVQIWSRTTFWQMNKQMMHQIPLQTDSDRTQMRQNDGKSPEFPIMTDGLTVRKSWAANCIGRTMTSHMMWHVLCFWRVLPATGNRDRLCVG